MAGSDAVGKHQKQELIVQTNGLGGHYDGYDSNSFPLPPQIATGLDHVYGWSRVHFANRTHMRHEFIASRNNSIMDTFWLYKEH